MRRSRACGGHVLALFVDQRIRPLRTLSATVAEIHDAGGLAIPAHPLVPYPLCAQGWVIRGLLDRSDERFHPDALETFNPTMLGRPWHSRVVRFAEENGLAMVGNSDAHALGAIGAGWTEFPGRTAADLRAAVVAHETVFHGSFHGTSGQVRTFGRQLAKYGRDAHAGSRAGSCAMAPVAISATRPSTVRSTRRGDEDRPRLPVHLPRRRRRRAARRVPLREPPPARPRRADHHRQPRPAALVGG